MASQVASVRMSGGEAHVARQSHGKGSLPRALTCRGGAFDGRAPCVRPDPTGPSCSRTDIADRSGSRVDPMTNGLAGDRGIPNLARFLSGEVAAWPMGGR